MLRYLRRSTPATASRMFAEAVDLIGVAQEAAELTQRGLDKRR